MAMRTTPLATRVTGLCGALRHTPARSLAGGRLKRFLSRSLCAERDRLLLDAAVAAIALLVGEDRLEQMTAPEVGPQRLGYPDLRVGDLPEQEVADAHLAAGPDQQIGIRLPRRVEKIAEAPLVEVVGIDPRRQHALHRVDDL